MHKTMRRTGTLGFLAALVGIIGAGRSGAHTVNADGGLNLRTGPGFGYAVIRVLANGTVVNTVTTSGSWTKIDRPAAGWVYSAYLQNTSHGGTTSGSNPHGLPVSAVGFLNLPSSGYGFTTYTGAYYRWGVPRMVNGLITMGRRWKDGYPGITGRWLNFGDISLPNGGYFYPHQTHRDGRAVDMLPVTTSGSAGSTSVGDWNYSTYYTQKLANLHRSVWSVSFILHNNSRISGVEYYPGHYDHLHTYIY